MSNQKNPIRSSSEDLCIECGLCCTGHLFTYASLKDDEVPDAFCPWVAR